MSEPFKSLLSTFTLGDQTVFYLLNLRSQTVGMAVLPTALKDLFSSEGRWLPDPLVQTKLVGDGYAASYSQGSIMHGSESSFQLKYETQEVEETPEETVIRTRLKSPRITAIHEVHWKAGMPYLTVQTSIENTSGETQKLEYLTSFNLTGCSPVGEEERIADLNLYRLTSRWSGEGKILKQRMTDLHMEPSWSRHGAYALRYGQVGSMPVRGFFPWGVIEDEKYHWCLGAQLYHPGSWQMEVYSKDDRLSFAGGLADREFGHFLKTLQPGEIFCAPKAVLAAAVGDVDEISYRLTLAQEEGLADLPETEKDLPVLFNEYCTTWGDPSAENLKRITDAVRGHGFRYLVIDSGWYAPKDGVWYNLQGDWETNPERFPNGLKETADTIREAGMIPGLWLEMELAGSRSKAYHEKEDLFLRRDGLPLEDGGNRFWDMKKPETIEYLDERVIHTLRDNGFGYLKVDYNGNYGIGPDGEESFGEELRKSVLASRDYFRRIAQQIPGIVIENCASGGHRLEPSMMEVCSMASFSDAHECVSIPVIAANVHRAILPRQSQIWAVLRATDTDRRLYYSIINGLLGRLCVSGDVYDLTGHQWDIVDRGIAFYGKSMPVIRSGKSRRYGREDLDYNHLKGWQGLVREGTRDAEGLCLAVLHRFEEADDTFSVPLPEGAWQILDVYAEPETQACLQDGCLTVCTGGAYSAAAVLLKRAE